MMARKSPPPLPKLKQLLNYDPQTGLFTWLENRGRNGNGAKAGDAAGYIDKTTGYVKIHVDGYYGLGHRLAWYFMTGENPDVIDHINRIRHDNRFINLRTCRMQENLWNLSTSPRSKSGVRNVSWCAAKSKWQICLKKDGKSIHFGYVEDLELADVVAKSAREKYFGEFA